MKLGKLIGVLTLMFSIFVNICAQTSDKPEKVHNILLVDSYSMADLWTVKIRAGMQKYLEKVKARIKYDDFEFSTMLRRDNEAKESDVRTLQDKINNTKYDLIVICGTPATRLFLNGRLKASSETPLLVSSYRGSYKSEIKDLNMTGIESQVNTFYNIRLASQIQPQASKVFLISSTPVESHLLEKQITEGIPEDFARKVENITGTKYNTSELLTLVSLLPNDAVIIFDSWFSAKDSTTESSLTILPRLRQRFHGLILGRGDSDIELGATGGIVIVSERQGRQAGEMALRILNGEKPQAMAVEKGTLGYLLDYQMLAEAGIEKSNIPKIFKVGEDEFKLKRLNQNMSFFERYLSDMIYFAIIVLFALLFFFFSMLFNRSVQEKVDIMLQNLPMRIFVVDQSLKVLYCYVPDYPSSEDSTMIFENLREFPAEIRDSFITAVRQVFSTGRKYEMDYRLHNQLRHAKFQLLPDSNPFRTSAVMWISSDITELHMVHLETFRVADRLRLILDAISDGVISTDKEGKITLMNPVASKLTGYSQEVAEGKKIEDIYKTVNYIDGTRAVSPLKKALQTGTVVSLGSHINLVGKNGVRRHIADTGAPIKDAEGDITGGVLVFRDVTEEYERLDRLRANEVFMRNAARIGKFTYFRCNKQGKLLFVLEDENLWPYHNDTFTPPDEWVSPGDVEHFKTEWNKVINDEVPVVNMSYTAILNGKQRFFEMRVERSVNEISGQPEYCGVIHDVTIARESELLYRDNLKMLETIMNNLPGYVYVKSVDDDLRYVICNNRFEEMIGLGKEQVLGRRDEDIFVPGDEAPVKLVLENQKLLGDDAAQDTVELIRNKEGRQFIVRNVKNMISQSNGTRLMLGMGIDISRQYELEQKQKNAIKALNNYVKSERIINQLLSRISVEIDFDTIVNEMLKIIGENAGADRAYIFNYSGDQLSSTNRYEWVREDITPQIDNLQNINMGDYNSWNNALRAKQDIIIPDVENPPAGFENEKALLQAQNVQSLIASGIWMNNELTGYVGLDYVLHKKNFSNSDIHTVHSVVNLFLIASERQRQTNRIADSVSLQRQIVDNVTLPLMIVDLDYNIVVANPSTAREANVPLDQIPGMKYYEVICKQEFPPFEFQKGLAQSNPQVSTFEYDVETRKMVITTVPLLDRQGALRYFLISAIDITELTQQKQELQKAMELAQAADRAKSYFLATVSHELRTPLNAVIGFSELLQNQDIAQEEQVEYLRSINFAGNALLNLINDVLDLSKMEADQMTMSAVKTDVGNLVNEVVAVFKLKAQQKKIDLLVDYARVRYPLYIDTLRLRQIILNLVGNAVKFTSSGSVSIYMAFKPHMEENSDSGVLTIRVTDTGIGILPENIDKIFEPFVQEGFTRGNHVYEGSGLGLTITQRMVQKMGGDIKLTSELGRGSTFTVTINDIKFDKEDLPKSEKTQPQLQEKSKDASFRVLIIDDVMMNLKLLDAMLRKLNFVTIQASSGKEALEILEDDINFDIILTDLWMPGMSGIDMTKELRDDQRFKDMPIVAITADTEINAESSSIFDGVIHKPITSDALIDIFEKLINFKR